MNSYLVCIAVLSCYLSLSYGAASDYQKACTVSLSETSDCDKGLGLVCHPKELKCECANGTDITTTWIEGACRIKVGGKCEHHEDHKPAEGATTSAAVPKDDKKPMSFSCTLHSVCNKEKNVCECQPGLHASKDMMTCTKEGEKPHEKPEDNKGKDDSKGKEDKGKDNKGKEGTGKPNAGPIALGSSFVTLVLVYVGLKVIY